MGGENKRMGILTEDMKRVVREQKLVFVRNGMSGRNGKSVA
jgi:hypothetical protein